MPSERLWRPARTDVSATPPRLRPKGPVGPDFRRQFPAAAGTPKQSAVERLEADKAKYVKSQVALSKQRQRRGPARLRAPTGPAPPRPPLLLRKPLHPISLSPQFQLRPTASRLHPSHPRTPGPSPLKPVVVAEPSKPEKPPADPPERAAPAPPLPPSSPARTRLSSSSSRKRPSLTRSKSDLSDRCSRAGTELERFFNLCGLDPADLQERARSTSDIVSMASAHPGSECGASNRDNGDAEEEEEAGAPAARVPYGVSVIERNARVIKWLYGLRSAKDDPSKST
uniref:Family with sequence similarity 110 member A n=1 Tax=Tetraodon nigroviridis TaxID=99883 RepID=H3C1E9_TETNG